MNIEKYIEEVEEKTPKKVTMKKEIKIKAT